MRNIITLIEEVVGHSINLNNVEDLKKLNHNERLNLYENISEFYRKNFINNYLLNFKNSSPRYSVLTDSSGLEDSAEIWEQSEYIKKLLLYYPNISILDPIDDVLNLMLDSPDSFDLVKPMRKILPLKKLIQDGVVNLIPVTSVRSVLSKKVDISEYLYSSLSDENIYGAFREYNPDVFNMMSSVEENLLMMSLSEEEKDTVKSLSHKNISRGVICWSALIIKEIYGRKSIADLDNSQMTIVSKADAHLLSTLMSSNINISNTIGKKDDWLSTSIYSMSLPNINNLSWEDTVLIRENEEDFYFWREAWKKAILESENMNYTNEQFMSSAKDILSSQSRTLKQAIKSNSSLKHKFIDSWVPAGIGFVSGAITGSPGVAVANSVLTGSLSLLYLLFARNNSKTDLALYNHFSIFINKV